MTDDWESKGLWERFKQDYRERGGARGGMVRPSPLPVGDFLDSYVGRHAAGYVRAYDDQRPMCLFVGFGGPHEQNNLTAGKGGGNLEVEMRAAVMKRIVEAQYCL